MMKAKEIKNLSVEELTKKLNELKKDLFMLRMQHATRDKSNLFAREARKLVCK